MKLSDNKEQQLPSYSPSVPSQPRSQKPALALGLIGFALLSLRFLGFTDIAHCPHAVKSISNVGHRSLSDAPTPHQRAYIDLTTAIRGAPRGELETVRWERQLLLRLLESPQGLLGSLCWCSTHRVAQGPWLSPQVRTPRIHRELFAASEGFERRADILACTSSAICYTAS